MNIPNVPTDSLYKFMSLAGTIIVISAFYIMTTQSIEVEKFRFKIKMEAVENHLSINLLREKSAEINELINKLKLKKKESKRLLNEIKVLNEQFNELSHQIDIGLEKRKINADELVNLSNRGLFTAVLGSFFILLGIFLSAAGFWAWYIKIQIPLDKLLKNQLLESENASKETFRPFSRKMPLR